MTSSTEPGPEATDAQQATLAAVAAAMIPAAPERDLPAADDPAILADILASVGRDAAAMGRALDLLTGAAKGDPGALRDAAPGTLLARFRADHPSLAAVLELAVAQCYYRDDRVLRAIGMEPRPPFPNGYPLEQGDWSLLDPVRARGRLWRAPDAGDPT